MPDRPSHFDRLANRTVLSAASLIGLGVFMIVLSSGVFQAMGEVSRATLSNVGSAFLGVGIGLLFAYFFRDPLRSYIGEIMEIAYSNPAVVRRLNDEAQRDILRSILTTRIPWCSDALLSMIEAAKSKQSLRSKRRPMYSFTLQDMGADAEVGVGTSKVAFPAAHYYRLCVEDDVTQDPSMFQGDVKAVFVLEQDAAAADALSGAFRETGVIYRDFLTLRRSEREAILRDIDARRNAKSDSGSIGSYPYQTLATLKLEVTADVNGTDRKVECRPTEFRLVDGAIILIFRGIPRMFEKFPLQDDDANSVRVRMMAECLIDRDAGGYPIILSSFSYDPEIRVAFESKTLERTGWINFLVTSDPHEVVWERERVLNGFRVHTRHRRSGQPRWVFPGSGILVRWRET